MSRFQREAEVLASLNHPNIAGIHSLEEADGSRFLVLELVEGETLAERIRRGAIPIDEALQIAKGICEALEAAHEKGVIHRDLKPANVKVTPEGQVKVLDFGLAKALENSRRGEPLAIANPELGRDAGWSDSGHCGLHVAGAGQGPQHGINASDIFAFGGVLYEMLTGTEDVSRAKECRIFSRPF